MPDLAFEVAKNLAGSLTTIGHPFSQAAINATAMDLVKWCKGIIIGGRAIGPEEQAEQLVDEARFTWTEWPEKGGTRQLLALFRTLFPAPSAGTQPGQSYAIPREHACGTCSDTGWEIVECEEKKTSSARPCRACGAKRANPEPQLCPKCNGKETITYETDTGPRRILCPCVPPERRQRGLQLLIGMLKESA